MHGLLVHRRSRELRHSHEGVKTELAKSDAELAQANIECGSQPGLTRPTNRQVLSDLKLFVRLAMVRTMSVRVPVVRASQGVTNHWEKKTVLVLHSPHIDPYYSSPFWPYHPVPDLIFLFG